MISVHFLILQKVETCFSIIRIDLNPFILTQKWAKPNLNFTKQGPGADSACDTAYRETEGCGDPHHHCFILLQILYPWIHFFPIFNASFYGKTSIRIVLASLHPLTLPAYGAEQAQWLIWQIQGESFLTSYGTHQWGVSLPTESNGSALPQALDEEAT